MLLWRPERFFIISPLQSPDEKGAGRALSLPLGGMLTANNNKDKSSVGRKKDEGLRQLPGLLQPAPRVCGWSFLREVSRPAYKQAMQPHWRADPGRGTQALT